MRMDPTKKREFITLGVVFAIVLVVSALAVYLIGGRNSSTDSAKSPAEQPSGAARETPQSRAPARDTNNDSIVDRMFGNNGSEVSTSGERWAENLGRLSLRLLLAALLGAALAFRPRKRILAL